MTGPAFLSVVPGTLVVARGRRFKISHVLGLDAVLAQDIETKVVEQLPISTIGPALPETENAPAATRDIQDIPTEEWQVAQQRYDLIRPLLEDPFRTRRRAEEIARGAKIHVTTLYQWLRAFTESRHLACLIPQKRGRRLGANRLDPALEAIVDAAINDLYLSRQRHRVQDVVDEVSRRCRTAGITPPHSNTIRNRIRAIPTATAFRRRGMRDKARNQFEPVLGNFPGADFPLAVVQIDHSEADIIVVEEHTRLPMGRPWVTLAIDVYSRMVVGCYVSMDRPNGVATGMCLARAMLPKGEYLAELEIPGEWPVWGKIRAVHADNAKEFRGAMLQTACKNYTIDLQLRPVKLPHYGGHIERLMGTGSNEIRKLPGTTFSSPKERAGYDSDKESALTLYEFEQNLVDFIVNVYHQRVHGGLKMPPVRRWQAGIFGGSTQPGVGLPELPADPARMRLDFLPFMERTVQPYGIVINHVYYYHEVLNSWINAVDEEDPRHKRLFIVRTDFRDISQVYFYDPKLQQYFAIPYRDTSHPAISVWELQAAQRRLKEEGIASQDEQTIFAAVERRRSRVKEAIGKTKAARRHHHRVASTNKIARAKNTLASPAPTLSPTAAPAVLRKPSTPATAGETSGDIFDQPVTPFDDLRA